MTVTGEPRCRSCGQAELDQVIDFGPMPLANRLLEAPEDGNTEPRYPLAVAWCPHCSLLQVLETPSPEILFTADYPYFSSVSQDYAEHARQFAVAMIERRHLGPRHTVLEIASNDGYLLRHFKDRGIGVVGFEPTAGPAGMAERIGVTTRREFFTKAVAAELAQQSFAADLVVGNNVLAHVPDPNDLIAGVATVLRPGGLACFEMPYVGDMVERLEFDTIYHEHHCYFSLRSIEALFTRNGLRLVDAERLAIHGGSLRVFATADHDTDMQPTSTVAELLLEETGNGIADGSFLEGFADRVESLAAELKRALLEIKANGGSIAAYGAAAKGVTLLNACGIDGSLVDFIVDRNQEKQGRLLPGVRIPILPPETLLARQPDFVLLLTWNFANEIFQQQKEYIASGGRFIIPVPSVKFHPPSHRNA
jgi:SAM-dependent methyltransferase